MSNSYQGMRWLKSDLQVQTPEDAKHWLDKDLQLGNPRRPKGDENDIQNKARKFLYRCHELELDLIGLTDHNFSEKRDPRDWFSVHLLEQNKSVARELGRSPLILLPGFEVDIGYHVLCLFAPAKKQNCFEKCNTVLTSLGLQEDKRFVSGKPQELRRNDQVLSLKILLETVQGEHGGIVIAAHSDSDDGIIDKGNKEDFKNESLFCVEITQNPPSTKIDNILKGSDVNWKRENKQPAFIMSSDAKSIQINSDGYPNPNSLGYRHTWIKMSKPSIESLRQAFLDCSSRIRLPIDIKNDLHPEKLSENNIIKSISVKNVAFLKDQEVHFSSSFNCIIGGRGSGKSTLIEYLRTAFKKDKIQGNTKASEKVERVQSTLNSMDARIEVHWQSDQLARDTIVWQKGKGSLVTSRTVIDNDKYFSDLPISFYSQQQLNDLSASVVVSEGNRQAGGLLNLLNSFVKDDLLYLNDKESEIKLEIDKAYIQHRKLIEMKSTQQNLEHDFNELDLKWKARNDIKEDAALHELLTSEKNHLSSVWNEHKRKKQELENHLDMLLPIKKDSLPEKTPNKEWIEIFDKNFELATQAFIDKMKEELKEYTDKVLQPTESKTGQDVSAQLSKAHENFEKACHERGMSIDDVANLSALNSDRIKKHDLLCEINQQIHDAEIEAKDIEILINNLHKVWDNEYELRYDLAKLKSDEMKRDKTETSMIKVSVLAQQDYKSFEEYWTEFSPSDARTRLGKHWSKIGEKIYSDYISFGNLIASSPWELLNSLIDQNSGKVDFEFEVNVEEDLYSHIVSNPDKWLKLRCQRVLDSVDIELFRHDGKSAGSISDNNLSDGQRNTAVLALLLSQDGGPLVIDQPEDELDSNFVYKELIPLLRSMKHKRQLIIATHNANLPVNGDAEMIYAFDVEDGKGVMKACGGLDNPEVTKAILDIMEGTEEAFRRRREKYSF